MRQRRRTRRQDNPRLHLRSYAPRRVDGRRRIHRPRQSLSLFVALATVLVLALPRGASAQLANLSATDGLFEDRVVLSWQGTLPAGTSIQIERQNVTPGVTEDPAVIAIRARTETEFIDRSIIRGDTYSYTVFTSGVGDTLSAVGSTRVLPPTGVGATYNTREDGVLVTWSDRSDVEVAFTITRDGGPLATTGANAGLFLDESATAGVVYEYCVSATDAGGVSSVPACATGLRSVVSAPGAVSASDGQYQDFVRVTFNDLSENEDAFQIYTIDFEGNPTLVGSVAGDASVSTPGEPEVFDDTSALFGITQQYCVVAVIGGSESAYVCDNGTRGLLALPTNVTSSYDDYDDRIAVSWVNATDIPDGFLVRRTGPGSEILLGQVGRDARSYSDETASQEVEYTYCVTAFSTVDADSTFSNPACAAPGRRTTVLPPLDVAATDDQYEDRVGLTWSDGASTAMLFNVYRDGSLIDNVPVSTPFFVDVEGPANVTANYCVTAVSVTNGAFSIEESEQLLEEAKRFAGRTLETGMEETSASRTFAAFKEAVAARSGAVQSGATRPDVVQSATMGVVETAPICDEGRRELLAPSAVTASYDEFEDRVQVTWTDNSRAEAGYIVRRFESSSGATLVDTVAAGRQSLGDFAGVPGVEYEYRVTAYDERGVGGESASDTDVGYRALKAPTAVQATDGTSETEVQITWIDNSRFETGYEVLRDDVLIGSVAENATSFTATGAALGTVHSFAVRATDGLGASAEDADDGNTAILPPGNVSASEQYADKVVISWNDESDIESLYWVSRNGVNLSSLAANTTTYTDNAPPGAGPYTYCVETAGANNMRASSCDEGGLLVPAGALASSGVGVSELIRADNSAAGEQFRFGSHVTVDGDKAIVVGGLTNVRSTPFVFSNGSWQRLPLLANTSGGYASVSDISGDLAIVKWSTPSQVSMLQFTEGAWSPKATFSTTFVSDVAIDGGRAAAGEFGYAGGAGNFQGRIRMFDRSATGAWSETVVLPSAPAAGEQFGQSLALSGDYLAAATNASRVVLFHYDGSAWNQIQVLTAPDCGACTSVAMDGEYLVVSDNTDASVNAHVFERTTSTQWTKATSLTGSNSVHEWSSVDISGKRIAVGTPGPNFNLSIGAAWIFERSEAGWAEVAALLPASADGTPLSTSYDFFGSSVSISDDFAFVGSSGFDPNGNGAVFIQPLVSAPSGVAVSDGTFDDRIQLTWTDSVANEELFNVYRHDGNDVLLVGTTPADGEFFDDFGALPGGTYQYCVSASNSDIKSAAPALGVSDPVCDTGWRPANGTISGQISALASTAGAVTAAPAPAALANAAVADNAVDVCIAPNPNKAVQFDGVGGYVSVPYVPATTQRTACAWFKTTADGGGLSVINWGSREAGDLAFLHLFNGLLYYGEVGSGFNQVWTPFAVNTGDWVHACVVKDGNTATIYIDGQQVATSAGFTFTTTTDLLTIGAARQGATIDSYFKGEIDDVQIWDAALSQPAIDAIFGGATTGEEPDVAAYWPFDQASGRVAADVSASAAHGTLIQGVHWVNGPVVGECVRSDQNGNYTFTGLRYGEEATFTVRPQEPGRSFTPSQKDISLSLESPIENQVDFNDNTQLGVAGLVQFAGTTCPAPDIQIQVDGQNRTPTEADGTFALSLFPSSSPTDLYRIRPQFTSQDPSDVTQFSPQYRDVLVDEDLFGINFENLKTRTLSGYYGGSCAASGNLGSATVRVFTEDGCFDQTYPVSGNFEIDLPPQKYLVEVVSLNNAPAGLEADMLRFFDDLGAREVDLSSAADTLDFIFRPDLIVQVNGLPAPPAQCSSGLMADGRSLPNVPIIGKFETVPVTLSVVEDYGNGNFCPVTDGKLQVFDAISDLDAAPQVFDLESADGVVEYDIVGASPNITSGAFVNGVDRSFQKSLTVVANVVGKAPAAKTEWALVEGTRVRTSEFISATTTPFPLLILRDPPGSNSTATLEKGTKTCDTINNMTVIGGEAGTSVHLEFGFTSAVSVGFGIEIETGKQGAGGIVEAKGVAGRDNGTGSSLEICHTATETWSTSDDPSWTGEDLYMGVALNLLFARADQLEESACVVGVTETLAADIDPDDAFETTYVYGTTHIATSLIPALEDLIEINGDVPLTGDPDNDGNDDTVTLEKALANWRETLANADSLEQAGLAADDVKNISFSSGANYEYSQTDDESSSQVFSTRIHASGEFAFGIKAVIFDFSQEWLFTGSVTRETTWDSTRTNETTRTVGYTLSDGDTGDFFSVDVGMDPRYHTPVYGIVSGRSSNPWEQGPGSVAQDGTRTCGFEGKPCTQRRDWPEITVNPPVLYDIDPDEAGNFELTLTNRSENNERRQYTLAVPGETNPRNLGLTVTGDLLGGERLETFTLEGGESRTINLDVHRVSPTYAYEDVGLMLYPANDYAIWQGDPRTPFATSDTAFISVYFDAPCTDVSILRPESPWYYNSSSGPLELLLDGFSSDVGNADSLVAVGVQYRRVGSPGWFLADSAHVGTIGQSATSWVDGLWTPPQDGEYELRAFSECVATQPGDNPPPVYSDIVAGTVDNKPPVIFGTPEPADQILTLGQDISITFDEPVACESFVTNGTGTNTTLSYASGANQGTQITGLQRVCDGRTVILAPPPTFDWAAAEGVVLEASIDDITDLAGNELAGDATTWMFTVRRSAFVWSPANVDLDITRGTEAKVTAQLVNGRATDAEFDLPLAFKLGSAAGDTVVVTPSLTTGTVVPGGTATVSFLIPETLPLGEYSATLEATRVESGFAQEKIPFYVNANVVCAPPPSWAVNPAAFEYSMTMTATLNLSGTNSTDGNDLVVAKVGNEVRGVAGIDDGRISMIIFSNTIAGETVRFEVWDDSACTLFDETGKTFVFENNAVQGTVANPTQIVAPFVTDPNAINLAAGWTWMSLNKTPADAAVATVLADIAATPGDVIKYGSNFSIFDEQFGWVGTLATVDPGPGYQIYLQQSNALLATGAVVDLASNPIAVQAGWNWVGYLPQTAQPVNDALQSLGTASNGDVIKSQFGFAQFDSGTWYGSLTDMKPGLGYQLNVANAGTITYTEPSANSAIATATGYGAGTRPNNAAISGPASAEFMSVATDGAMRDGNPAADRAARDINARTPRSSTSPPSAVALRLNDTLEDGSESELNPGDFETSMTVTATVTVESEVTLGRDGLVWVVDEEGHRRGQGRVVPVDGYEQYRLFLMIYGHQKDESMLTIRAVNPDDGEVVEVLDGIRYESDAQVGTIAKPLSLNLSAAWNEAGANQQEDLPGEFGLTANFPNPFRETTTIHYELPEKAKVKLTLFDMLGREVRWIVDGEQEAGRYDVQFDARGIASGVYMYRMKAGDFVETHKMTIVK